MKSHKLEFKASAYREAKRNHSAKLTAFEDILKELSHFIDIEVINLERLKEAPLKYTEELYLDKYKKGNTLNLSFAKLANQLEDDFSALAAAAVRYEGIKADIDHKPTEEEFSVYTSTKEQNERFERIAAIIENAIAIPKLNQATTLIRLFKGTDLNRYIEFNSEFNAYRPRTHYVLNGEI